MFGLNIFYLKVFILLKGKNLFPLGTQSFFFQNRPSFRRGFVNKTVNRNSHCHTCQKIYQVYPVPLKSEWTRPAIKMEGYNWHKLDNIIRVLQILISGNKES